MEEKKPWQRRRTTLLAWFLLSCLITVLIIKYAGDKPCTHGESSEVVKNGKVIAGPTRTGC